MNGLITTHSLGNAAYMGLAWPTLDAGGLLAFWETGNEEAYHRDAGFDRLAQAAHPETTWCSPPCRPRSTSR